MSDGDMNSAVADYFETVDVDDKNFVVGVDSWFDGSAYIFETVFLLSVVDIGLTFVKCLVLRFL